MTRDYNEKIATKNGLPAIYHVSKVRELHHVFISAVLEFAQRNSTADKAPSSQKKGTSTSEAYVRKYCEKPCAC